MSEKVSKVLSMFGVNRKNRGRMFARMPRDEHEFRGGLVAAVAGLAQIAEKEVDTAKSFAQLGFDSLQAMKFTGLLEKSLGIELDPTLLWDHPTIDALSVFLVDRLGLERKESIA